MKRVIEMSIEEMWKCYWETKQPFVLRILRSKHDRHRNRIKKNIKIQ